jgi:hypothetical protein
MDYTLIALIGLIVFAVVASNRFHSRTWSGRPGYQYQRAISAGVFGLWFIIAGAIGWDLSNVHGFFRGTKWVDGPVWWQVGLGAALIALAAFLARRVPADASRTSAR